MLCYYVITMPTQNQTDIPHSPNLDGQDKDPAAKNRTRLIAGGALALGATVLSVFGGHNDAPKPAEDVGVVQVQPNTTFSEISEQVAINTPEKDTMQEAAERLRELNPELPRYPNLTAGQELVVPTAADANPDLEGVQLSPPQ